MRRIRQPGPPSPRRQEVVTAAFSPVTVTLAAGPLDQAVAAAMEGLDCAWLTLSDAPVDGLAYLYPAAAPDETHAAWYAGPERFGRGRIGRLGMTVGRHDGAWFIHGHGDWWAENGPRRAGHILADETVLERDVRAVGLGVVGGTFERGRDPETNFDLFRPAGGQSGDGALVRLCPNQDLEGALDEVCNDLGWSSARIHGLGSVIGAVFEDGRQLTSYATEMLILDGMAHGDGRPRPGVEILITGTDGETVMEGRLKRGENPVLITAEICLERL